MERKKRERRVSWSLGKIGWYWRWLGRTGEEERVVVQPMVTTVGHGGGGGKLERDRWTGNDMARLVATQIVTWGLRNVMDKMNKEIL